MATCTPVRVGLCMALFPIVLFGNVTSSQKQCYPIPLLLYYLSDDATGQSRTSETQHRHSFKDLTKGWRGNWGEGQWTDFPQQMNSRAKYKPRSLTSWALRLTYLCCPSFLALLCSPQNRKGVIAHNVQTQEHQPRWGSSPPIFI